MLDAPLTQDGAVELAMIDSAAIARLGGALGLDDSDRFRMLHVPDDKPIGGEESRIERSFTANLSSWLAKRMTNGGDLATRWAAVSSIGALVFDIRRAWVSAVEAQEAMQYRADVLEAAVVALDVAERMRRIGHNTPLDLVREQRFHADALEDLTRSQLAASLQREHLAGLIGLWGPDIERIRLPSRLPDLPPAAIGSETLESRAVAQRLDIRQAQLVMPQLTEERAVAARSELRRAWLAYHAYFDLAVHAREEVLPLARRASDEELRRYNGMLESVFALIADARNHINATLTLLDAEGDFWLAEVDLQQSLAGMGGTPLLNVRSTNTLATDAGSPHSH